MSCSGTRRLSRSRQKKKRKGKGHSQQLSLKERKQLPGYSKKQIKLVDKSHHIDTGMVTRLYGRNHRKF